MSKPDYSWRILMCCALYFEIMLFIGIVLLSKNIEFWLILLLPIVFGMIINTALVMKEYWNGN